MVAVDMGAGYVNEGIAQLLLAQLEGLAKLVELTVEDWSEEEIVQSYQLAGRIQEAFAV